MMRRPPIRGEICVDDDPSGARPHPSGGSRTGRRSFPSPIRAGAPPCATVPQPAVAAGGDAVIAAAGDIACDPGQPSFNGGAGASDACRQRDTSDLVLGGGYAAVLTLGDTSYYCSSYSSFLSSFDPSWGR